MSTEEVSGNQPEEVSVTQRPRGRASNSVMTRLSRLALLDAHFRGSQVVATLNLLDLATNHYVCVSQSATGYITLIEGLGSVTRFMHAGVSPGDRRELRQECLRIIQYRYGLAQRGEQDQERFLGGFLMVVSDCLLCLYTEARQGLVRRLILQRLEDAVVFLKQRAK